MSMTSLSELGLLDRSDHHPGELSVGERQRVALGRALINSPALLLADEPTGNLDPANAGRILGILESFQGDGGTVVLVTHSPLVPRTKHRVVQIEDGRIAGHDAAGVE